LLSRTRFSTSESSGPALYELNARTRFDETVECPSGAGDTNEAIVRFNGDGKDRCATPKRHARPQMLVEVMGRYSNPNNVARLNRILSGQGRDSPSHRPVPSLKQKQTRLAESDRNEVVERYMAGETANALALRYGVNLATVFAILQRAGIKSRCVILTDRDIAAAIQMYENGQSLASIARHFNVSDGTVLHAFRRLGVRTRPQGTNQWAHKAATTGMTSAPPKRSLAGVRGQSRLGECGRRLRGLMVT
jgi:hypothetical protein